MPKRDYVIIIGAMKSGTTTLFDILARHPQIAAASNKEPGFFAFDDIWERGFDWFDTLFSFNPSTHRYRLEASTDYTKAPFAQDVWQRMTSDGDVSVKLIYIMRHPLRRMESHARHVQTARKEIGQQVSPRLDHALDAGVSLVNVVTSQYARQLDAFTEARAAGNLHYLTLERLQTEPVATLNELYDFLDLPPGPHDLPRSNAAGDRMDVNPAWRTLTNVPFVIGITKLILPSGLRNAIRRRFRKSKVRAEGRFALSGTEESALLQLLASDLERLRDEYEVDILGNWELDPKH